ncbi:MAG: type I-C CRISPR-associated protein Cas8c/Csd1 [Syntrophobacteraceae bacterium]
MILQALKQYYDRLAASDDDAIPRFGFARQKIHFCLLLDRQGKLVEDLDLRKHEGKKPLPAEKIVPEPVKRTGDIAPNFLWDNTGYVLGVDGKGKPERTARTFAAFKEFQHEIGDGLEDEGMKAVLLFLDGWKPEDAVDLHYREEMIGQNVVFRLDGEAGFVHDRPKVRDAWLRHYAADDEAVSGMCLVTGGDGPIARLHPAIKGVAGAQSSGAALVSFNLDAFKSYGKEQNFNAPIGQEATFAYTTALNWLLRGESRQKILIGDATVVFWTERENPAEDLLSMLLNPDASESDGGDGASTQDLRVIMEAVREGRMQEAVREPEVPFYILGLSPNASRLSVRFWFVSTVGNILKNVEKHFGQMSLRKSFPNEPDYPAVWRLLRETAAQGKRENVSPLLAGALMKAVLTGSAYPMNLLPSILTRIRADHAINYLRAGLIKACLIRNHNHTEVGVSLDKENANIGYRLGRLFAVLERVQTSANPGISSTIRDKYYGSASATPRNVFPMLISLAQQHLGKLRRDAEKKRRGGFYDSRVEEIVAALPAGALPAFLDPENQGLFALGYYHQRQDLFAGKSEREEED